MHPFGGFCYLFKCDLRQHHVPPDCLHKKVTERENSTWFINLSSISFEQNIVITTDRDQNEMPTVSLNICVWPSSDAKSKKEDYLWGEMKILHFLCLLTDLPFSFFFLCHCRSLFVYRPEISTWNFWSSKKLFESKPSTFWIKTFQMFLASFLFLRNFNRECYKMKKI